MVNAKLSEGINFGDDMARAVVMVGLPFPHAGDAELKEKMKFFWIENMVPVQMQEAILRRSLHESCQPVYRSSCKTSE